MTYVHIKELIAQNLIAEDSSRGVARFSATHPQQLAQIVQNKQRVAEEASASFNTVIHQLQQQFEVRSGQPGVRFFDGAKGLAYTNEQLKHVDINEMLLIRSTNSSKDIEGYRELIEAQNKLRLQKKIPLKVITPSLSSIKNKLPDDEANLIERRIIAKELFDTPAQILIYGNTVAITTYQEPTLTTIIEQSIIATTVQTLFMYIWRSSLVETQMFEEKLGT